MLCRVKDFLRIMRVLTLVMLAAWDVSLGEK
jgi:hypothetical protein